ncbi:MAG TPA: TonB family protein [Terriglobales bacterium]
MKFDRTPVRLRLESQDALAETLGFLTGKIGTGDLGIGELLHGIAEKARAETGASAAAVALRRDDDRAVVCRARSGDTAPGLGTPLNSRSGISGECLHTGKLQVCNDTESDTRVDAEACQRLGVRSIVVVPLDNGQETVGILEAFSDQAGAFSGRHVETLEMLAHLAKAAIAPSAVPAVPPAWRPRSDEASLSNQEQSKGSGLQSFMPFRAADRADGPARSRRLPWPIPASLIAVVALSVSAVAVFGWMLERRANANVRAVSADRSTTVQGAADMSAGNEGGTEALTIYTAPPDAGSGQRERPPLVQASEKTTLPPTNELEIQVTDLHPLKDVQRERVPERVPENDVPVPVILAANQPQANLLDGVLTAAPSLPRMATPVSHGAEPAKLTRRVEPRYPPQARQMRVEGPVTLRAMIGEDGSVREVEVVKGNAMLAQAAIDAVRKWQYEPYRLDHKPVAATTDITVVFKLQE